MSKPPRISYVVEGPTDYIVLDALVEHFLGQRDYVSTQIQPPTSEYASKQGLLGGGWHGVLNWCKEKGTHSGGFAGSTELANCDYLIIHVDADIAAEADLQPFNLSAPCPPARETCDKIRAYLISLLGGQLPPQVVLCIPAQCTEAWLFAALHPELLIPFQPIECREEVAKLLINKPEKLVRDKEGRARKQPEKYRDTSPKVVKQWPQATASCAEALRFETECRAALPK